ncbi:MAG: hypothetical protein ACR2RF_27580 [Geminicoccaceae bacterium]
MIDQKTEASLADALSMAPIRQKIVVLNGDHVLFVIAGLMQEKSPDRQNPMADLHPGMHQSQTHHFTVEASDHQMRYAVDRRQPCADPGPGKKKRAVRTRFEVLPHGRQRFPRGQARKFDLDRDIHEADGLGLQGWRHGSRKHPKTFLHISKK